MTTVTLYYDEIPKSANSGGGGARANPYAASREKRMWEGVYFVLFLRAKIPKDLDHITVRPELQFTDPWRRRDADNYYLSISKPLADTLVKGGYIPDDTPDHYSCERVVISKDKAKTRRLVVHLDF